MHETITIRPEAKWSYKVNIGDHEMHISESGIGDIEAPSPGELLAASLGTCNALVAEAFLRKHELSEEGVKVDVDYDYSRSPKRLSHFTLRVILPISLDEDMRQRFEAQLERCTIHQTLKRAPEVVTVIEEP